MDEVIFIGGHRHATLFRNAGIASYVPTQGQLEERVLAERGRCQVLAMTRRTFRALPKRLARELREGTCPRLAIVPDLRTDSRTGLDWSRIREILHENGAVAGAASA